MAERARSEPPADPKPVTNKPKNTSATDSPPKKRPHVDPDLEDTATSKNRDEEIDLPDLEVLEGIISYRSKKGVYPFENPKDMYNFCRPWIILGFGNENGWKKKIKEVKMKFKNRSPDPKEPEEKEEFELWMKIWGNLQGGSGDGLSRASKS